MATALQNLKPNKLGVVIKIQKNIPTFSGLSSQASNAAGVLAALNKLWGFDLNESGLIKIAEKVDPIIAKILKFRPQTNSKNVILVLPKYIKTDENWLTSHKPPYEKIACKYFPDLKEIVGILKKAGCEKCGMSGKGPMLYGFSCSTINKQAITELLGKKSEFIWIK